MAEKSTNKNTDKLYKALLSPKKALRAIINDMGGGIDDSTPYADYVTKYNGHKISAYVINAVNNLGTTLTTTIATKVDKTSSANKVYGTNGSGVQVTIDIDNYPNAEGSIARRSAQTGHVGQIQVPLTPVANGEASSKQYVDKSTAKSLAVSMDNSTYVITFTLKDGNNNTLSTQSVDLPLESTVVSGSYDDDTQSLVLTLKSGSTIAIPIDDLIDGLVSSADLSTTLANYYTKTEADNEFVDKTSTETITGTKTFQGDLKFQGSGVSTVGQITTASNSVKIGYGGVNHVSIDGGNFHTNVADYDLGSSSKKWRDVYVSRNLTDGTNAITVANILAKADKTYVDTQDNAILYALNNLRSMFYETTVDVETMLENYLSFKALPLTLNSKNIIFSAGMDLLNIKGNSFVYNQWAYQGVSDTYWTLNTSLTYATYDNASHTFTLKSQTNSSYWGITSKSITTSGHKYLVIVDVKTYSSIFYCQLGASDYSREISSSGTKSYLITGDGTNGFGLKTGSTNTSDTIVGFYIFDLTQSNITASDVAEAKAELLKRGVNVDEYNPYNVGQIRNSQPTKLISRDFNIWDEEWELGGIDASGDLQTANDRIRSKNKIKVIPNTTYYVKSSSDIYIHAYDENDNWLGFVVNGSKNTTFTTPSNCAYLLFRMVTTYGTTYNHDICINISNASLNGTYKPYVAPDEKTLTLPVLRSAGTVQDDCENAKVGEVDLGSLNYYQYSGDANTFYSTAVSNIKRTDTELLCSKGYTFSSVLVGQADKTIFISSNDLLYIKDSNYSDPTTFKNAMLGQKLNYVLKTPTPQSPAITLPQDIKIYAGGSIEVEYDSTNSCPSDFEFEVATSKIVEE